MLTLALDTATDCLSLALAADGDLLGEEDTLTGREHLEQLLPRAVDLLDRNGCIVQDLELLVVGLGPGTFSGLRVGIATVRALAQALETAVEGYSTLHGLALGLAGAASGTPAYVMPVIDAKRGQVFTRIFGIRAGGSLEAISGIECLDPDELDLFAEEHVDRPPLAGGNGAQAYRKVLANNGHIELLPENDTHHAVSASRLLELAGCLKGEGTPALGAVTAPRSYSLRRITELEPIYVREPDADKTVLLRKREPWQT